MTDRTKEWINASIKLGKELAYFTVDTQQLGQVEHILLGMEKKAVSQSNSMRNKDYDFNLDPEPLLMSYLLGLSKYWVFGMYELLRKFRDVISNGQRKKEFLPPYESFIPLFQKLELVRMPLAKYEAAKMNDTLHWPEIHFFVETGCCGWEVYSKQQECMVVISRDELSNDFLLAAQSVENV